MNLLDLLKGVLSTTQAANSVNHQNINPEVLRAGASVGLGLLQHGLNRNDYNYTYQMTSPAKQVQNYRDAHLNPALLYGQISAPQGETLGNNIPMYQGGNLKEERNLLQQQQNTMHAQEEYYRTLAFKTNEEGMMTQFNREHQEEVYNLDIRGKGLQNTRMDIENIIAAFNRDITEYERDMRFIDLQYYNTEKIGKLQNLVADTSLKLAERGLARSRQKTEDTLRDSRLEEIRSNILTMLSLRRVYNTTSNLNRKRSLTERYTGLLKQSEFKYMQYLTAENKDFSKLDSRARWQVYAPAISQGINTAVNAGLMLYTRGLSGFLMNNSNTPAMWDNYGPGRDHLGH